MTTPPPPGADPAEPSDPTDPDLGRRLADWLDGLDLLPHLAAAGLPTVVRDADGAVTWVDPATGEPCTPAQVADLERDLRSQGDDPAHAVPVGLLQVARQARVRSELLASPWYDAAGLAALRGTNIATARYATSKAASEHRLLVARTETEVLVPAFQLDAAGDVRPELVGVLEALLGGGVDPWRAWAWLTRPAGLLAGDVPEQAAAEPDLAAAVVHAARRLAAAGRSGR